jgi:hypothetical protein
MAIPSNRVAISPCVHFNRPRTDRAESSDICFFWIVIKLWVRAMCDNIRSSFVFSVSHLLSPLQFHLRLGGWARMQFPSAPPRI